MRSLQPTLFARRLHNTSCTHSQLRREFGRSETRSPCCSPEVHISAQEHASRKGCGTLRRRQTRRCPGRACGGARAADTCRTCHHRGWRCGHGRRGRPASATPRRHPVDGTPPHPSCPSLSPQRTPLPHSVSLSAVQSVVLFGNISRHYITCIPAPSSPSPSFCVEAWHYTNTPWNSLSTHSLHALSPHRPHPITTRAAIPPRAPSCQSWRVAHLTRCKVLHLVCGGGFTAHQVGT